VPQEARSIRRRILVVCGLSAAAFAAPILDIYGRNPEVFVANRTSPAEILLFGIVVAATIPVLATLLLYAGEKIGPRTGDFVYTALVVVLALATGLIVSRQLFPDSTLAAALVAIGVGVVLYFLQRRFESVVAWFSLALPAVVILFVATSPTARLIWAEAEQPSESASVAEPAPLVMIQLDEMPTSSIMTLDGGINTELFPNFARLAEEGTWYRNAFSSSIATTQSVPAILTGRLGERGMSPSSVDHPENLFMLLEDSHEMHVIEWVADLCPEDVCPDYAGRAPLRFSSLLADVGVVYGHLTLPVLLREDLPSIDNAWKGFLGQNDTPGGVGVRIDDVPVPNDGSRANWVNWMQRLINGIDDGPVTFSYAHLQAPHVPWQINPSGTHYERPEEYTEVEGVGGDGRWGGNQSAATMGLQRHLYQVGFVDTMLGRLFAALDETGTWDQTMIVVLADHGASFDLGEHRRWPYEDNLEDLYRVPMFVKYPHQTTGEVRDEPVYGIDVVPTIVDVFEIDTDWEFDGISLKEVEGNQRAHQPVWWCCSEEGADTNIATLLAQVERKHQIIPDQSAWLEVAGVGPYADLVGGPIDTLQIEVRDDLRWSLDLGKKLGEVDIDSGRVQTLLTGRIEFPASLDPDDLIVALNGTIAGTGYVSQDGPTSGSLRALLAEELVMDGTNEIDILVPSGDSWVSGSADVITLDLIGPGGDRLELVAEGNRRIQVNEVVASDTGWSISGWAADAAQKVPPDMIHVFAGERLLVSGPPNEDNANVVRWFDSDDLLRSGFTFEIDGADLGPEVEQLNVVAEFGDVAVADPAPLNR
jgi:hypothetical protein